MGKKVMVEEQNTAATSEVDLNFRAFQEKLPELLATCAGKLAVMHAGQIVDFFDSYADAVRFGQEKFGHIGNFSVQEVTTRVISLGFYSCAVSHIH